MPLRIIGQGLAGSLLGWACEKADVPFRIIDAGHRTAASRVAAGLINPLTGRRLALTWRFAEWRDEALACYRELETALGRPLVTEIRIRRLYRSPAERARFEARLSDPAAARWINSHDSNGLWTTGGAQVDTAALISGLRERWLARGWLREETAAEDGAEREPVAPEPLAHARCQSTSADRIIWCTGAERVGVFDFVPWERAKGEIISGELEGLEPGVLLSDGHWVLPGAGAHVRVGATYDRAQLDTAPSEAARGELVQAALRLTGRTITLSSHGAALRVTTPDRRPVVGWHPSDATCGVFSGLGSKGALWAPALARQWLQLLQSGRPVEPEVNVARFAR
jgi:glycine oxidase